MSVTFPFGLPQNPHFAEFIYYSDLFLSHEVNRVRSLWDTHETQEAKLSAGQEATEDKDLRRSKVTFIAPDDQNQWIYQKLASVAVQSNNERYGFDIHGFHHGLQLARYGEGDFFDWHLDFGPGQTSNRKLSISVQLSDSDEYEGGDLQFMINQKIVNAPRAKGTIVVFPSFIIHRVTPITKGERQSIVGWLAGPPYR